MKSDKSNKKSRPPYVGIITFLILIVACIVTKCSAGIEEESVTDEGKVIPANNDGAEATDSIPAIKVENTYVQNWLEE